jgi:hypothetical protein
MNYRNFIELHKNKNWRFPTPPKNLSPIELTEWLFHQDDIGWLKLDVNIDLPKWQEESKIAEKFYVDHRGSKNYSGSEHKGWKSCCMHGISVTRTEAVEDANQHLFHWTELSKLVPTISSFWRESFPVEYYRRLRFMCLDPSGYIGVHNDLPTVSKFKNLKELDPLRNTISVNVAVIHPSNCDFVIENFGTIPISQSEFYIINNTKNHCVVNDGDFSRIHVIAECVVGNRINDFSELIYKSFKKEHGYY